MNPLGYEGAPLQTKEGAEKCKDLPTVYCVLGKYLVAASYSVVSAKKQANKVDPLCSMCWNNLGSCSWSRLNSRRLESGSD